ncbi:uncharacterized protein MYCGRDRAFT_89178 [Zymoseptoria tritici IPO323]|uniref:DUF3328 domain-containing protein n=1 Tax=Zymoseptoria tritici (strain CBS 115943 / IPO323) TaxID=336722 RepID=F9WZY7_ZYMTI|nr:uncharacterized protein MYCGRDRAFT_89178 [Zymoseptoria tritici IPO323]EGP91139.1 hypothetical protein MYCGRDRAFT_89178 [Zymoseptoria tritici IPO323]
MEQYKEISSSDSGDELLASFHERRRQRKYSFSSMFFIGTLAGSFCFNMILLFLLWRATEHSYSGPSARRLAEEFNGLVPKVPLKTVVFNQDPNFVPYDRNMTYLEKDRLVSTNWKQAFMPRPCSISGTVIDDKLTLSCPLQKLIFRAYLAYSHGHGHVLPEGLTGEHVYHCFDYLRQSLMCAGDTALEGADPASNGTTGTHGLGVTHVCKDWDALMEMAVDMAEPLDELINKLEPV